MTWAVVALVAAGAALSYWLQKRSGIRIWQIRSQHGRAPGSAQSTIDDDAWQRTFPGVDDGGGGRRTSDGEAEAPPSTHP